MDLKQCEICGAKWINSQLYWSTGKPGKDLDLAALVCNRLPPEKAERCVNLCKGQGCGEGWEERMKKVNDGLARGGF